MKALRSFGAFWYDFIVGDDPWVAVGVVAGLAGTALLAHNDLTAWWLLPVLTAVFLAGTLTRAIRRRG
jgi:hypothetical protein